ncbi:MAG: HEAT repeat domain-containing protein [Deltaproteobacteria bacterium]|nr:HEAT repeat domain-containing protein [Deltaproteobacteria bacterium]MBW2379082.1 HEAT repeat domain-containing protein [Deltaproteobacteria bacterium]MBW2550099.1 HEAT repeat domain-containing protein [Deltaproteobacteria bacterium]MBW2626483.1 HEAT repeat domain-containing protein [Deltaproteobacteria bacterium]
MIVRHRGWAVAVLVATLGLGCHAAEDDPEGQASELSDPVRRENAVFNLKKVYTETLAANGGDRSSADVKAVADVIVDPLTRAYIDYPEDRINGLHMLDLLHEMQDPRSLPALLEALNWRTEVSEDHATRAAQTIQAMDIPAAERANVIQALARSLERITDSRSEDNKMRVSMIRALGSLKDKGATEILTNIATKQDEKQNFIINRLAAQQLGELRDPAAIPALIKCLFLFAPNHPELRMNDVAAEALILIGRPSLKPLLAMLAGKDATANAIAKQYIDAIKARRPDLARSIAVRQVTGGEASFALGALGFSQALEPLLQEAASSDTARKLNAAIALVRVDVPEAQKDRVRTTLKRVYGDLPKGYQGVAMRAQLIAVIAHTYDAEMMPFIYAQVVDKKANPDVRLIAVQNYALLANKAEAANLAQAIANEKPSEAGGYREKFEERNPLLDLANECDTNVDCWVSKASSADADKARKGAYMLGRYAKGNDKAIDALVGQLGNEDLGVRLAALMALDKIAVEGSPGAVAKIDELRTREEGQSVWTRFRGEALPIQARLRSRAGDAG